MPRNEELKMVEHIIHDSEILALTLSNGFKKAGTYFIAPSNFSQQLVYMHHPASKVIGPHIHKLTGGSGLADIQIEYVTQAFSNILEKA